MKTREINLPTMLAAKIERFAKDHNLPFGTAMFFLIAWWYHQQGATETK